MSTKPLEPVPTLSLIRWDGANMSGLARGHTGSCMGWGLMERQSHGPPTAGRENGLLMGPLCIFSFLSIVLYINSAGVCNTHGSKYTLLS